MIVSSGEIDSICCRRDWILPLQVMKSGWLRELTNLLPDYILILLLLFN